MKINKNFISIILILFILILGFIFFKNNIYSPLSDIGRELYIPTQMAKGNVLFKDIFCVYPPFAYYLNAIIVKFFGNSLNIFYSIGFLLSLISLIGIYCVSKLYTNRLIALLVAILITVSCTFYPSISNWITPYSYSIMYALASILWALYFLIKYFDKDEKLFLYCSVFLYGLSVCCKYEYILFLFAVLFVIIKKRTDLKTVFKSILFCSIVPALVLVILLIQNVSLNDLIQTLKYATALSNSFSVKYFYSYSGLTLTPVSIKSALISLYNPHFVTLFYSFSFLSIITFIFVKNSRLILLNLSAILIIFKSLGGISFEIYGTYFFPVLLILAVSILYSKINKEILAAILVVLILCYSYFIVKNQNYEEINTPKGIIKTDKIFKKQLIKVTDFVKTTGEKEKILILPEGILINYLADRKTDNYLFYLIPPNVEIFGEDFIKNRMENEKYKYIIVTNQLYPWYNETSFMRGWGKNIHAYIKLNYTLKEVIGEDFKFFVYKINE